jgi:hypothetical protein
VRIEIGDKAALPGVLKLAEAKYDQSQFNYATRYSGTLKAAFQSDPY